MRIGDYPPQEPLGEAGRAYAEECLRLAAGIGGEEHRYGADPYQSLSLHSATRPDGRVLVFWHGGGWTSGYKEWMDFMAPAFTAAGVTFVTAGYRLAPAHVFPAGLEDCMAALAWVAGNVADRGGDPARIFIGGHSAGAHYASLLAVRRDWQGRHGLSAGIVRGCLPISGVYRFGEGSGLSARPRFLGGGENERPASPMSNIEGTPPPFLLSHGENDFPHLIRQAEEFERALAETGCAVRRVVLPGRTHFSASHAGGEPDGPWVPEVLAFMERPAG